MQISCDSTAYHQQNWLGNGTCQGEPFAIDYKWGECTYSGNLWTIVNKPGELKPGEKPWEFDMCFWAIVIGVVCGICSAHCHK